MQRIIPQAPQATHATQALKHAQAQSRNHSMPTTNRTSSHTRIARAPQQTRFPLTRTSKRRQPRQSLPLLREQTLTQIDWARPSLRTDQDHSSEGSEYHEDDDSDSVEMPPRKRCRTYGQGRAMKQTTVTQNWRDFVRVHSPSPHEDDEQPYVIDSEDDARPARHSRRAGRSNNENMDPDARGERGSKTPQEGTLDHAEYLLSIASSQQSRHALNLGSSDNERASGRPTPASSVKVYKTPQKPRRTVVPSSETPSSIRLSDDGASTLIYPQQSPLKERSSNVQTFKQCDSTSRSSRKHRIDSGSIRPGRSQQEQCEDENYLSNNAPITKFKFTSQRPARSGARTLQRVTTIQDSEDDEAGLIDLAHDMNHTDEEERQEWQLSARAPPSLRRATTVPESQVESDLEELEPEAAQLDCLSGADAMPATYDPMYQQTFDPVSTALERDATRFGRSSTQLTTLVWSEIRSPEEPSPSRWHDASSAGLDLEQSARDSQFCVPSRHVGLEPEGATFDESETTRSAIYEHAPSPTAPLAAEASDAPYLNHEATEHTTTSLAYVSASGTQSDQARLRQGLSHDGEDDFDRVPSSIEQERFSQLLRSASPGPRSVPNSSRVNRAGELEIGHDRIPQSQISTVMPTQCSRPSSAHGREQQSHSMAFVNTLSSSPFPMPPCDDTQGPYGRMDTQITDFSLPPPPAFSSSARQGSSL